MFECSSNWWQKLFEDILFFYILKHNVPSYLTLRMSQIESTRLSQYTPLYENEQYEGKISQWRLLCVISYWMIPIKILKIKVSILLKDDLFKEINYNRHAKTIRIHYLIQQQNVTIKRFHSFKTFIFITAIFSFDHNPLA